MFHFCYLPILSRAGPDDFDVEWLLRPPHLHFVSEPGRKCYDFQALILYVLHHVDSDLFLKKKPTVSTEGFSCAL